MRVNSYNDFIVSQGVDLLGSQPTKGNIRGGLTTIEEKALGNLEKIGRKCRFKGCLAPAEAPKGEGLWFMDTSSAAAEAVQRVGRVGGFASSRNQESVVRDPDEHGSAGGGFRGRGESA